MVDVIFVTGNQNKADYLAKFLGMEIEHHKIDVDEIQSMDLYEVAAYKAKQAYAAVQRPVLVEDQGLYFTALNGFPGPFIKFLVEAGNKLDIMSRMLDGFDDRSAVAKTVYVYYDGIKLESFSSSLKGTIAKQARGSNGWGWDPYFCPDGYEGKTRAELTPEQDEETYLRIKPIEQVRLFLESIS